MSFLGKHGTQEWIESVLFCLFFRCLSSSLHQNCLYGRIPHEWALSQLSASNISVRLSKRVLPQTATLFSHPPALPTEVMAMVVPMRDKAQCKHKRKRVKLLQKVLWSSQCSRSKDHWAIEANLIQGTSEKTPQNSLVWSWTSYTLVPWITNLRIEVDFLFDLTMLQA